LRNTDGVRWELSTVLAEAAASKTLFLFDPAAKDAEVWRSVAAGVPATVRVGRLGYPRLRVSHWTDRILLRWRRTAGNPERPLVGDLVSDGVLAFPLGEGRHVSEEM
jgi:hypothetical protein